MTSLTVILVAIAAMAWLPIAIRRRQLGVAGGPCPAGAPMGSRASAQVETLVVALMVLILCAAFALDGSWRRLLFDARDAEAVSVFGVVVLAIVVCGLVAAVVAARRGAGSIAVALGVVALLGYSVAMTFATTSPVWQQPLAQERIGDLELVIDISGCNVPGAELWANDVYLGKSPVQIKLSEFLERVPDWKSVPGEPDRAKESTSADRVSSAVPRGLHWGMMALPNPQYFRFQEPLETALRAREGVYVYIRTTFDGEQGLRTGSSGGGGSDTKYSYSIDFRFPKRDTAIERLLDQARLVDYQVDAKWLAAAAAFGPDAWIAIREVAVDEPAMMRVFDAWVRRQYSLDESHSFGAASAKLEEIMRDADHEGSYLTAAPAGRAIELISPLLFAPNLAEAARPIIENTTSINYSFYERLFGQRAMSVTEDGKRRLSLPSDGTSNLTTWGGNGPAKQFSPANLVVAHAIWLARQRQNLQSPANAQADVFSEIIGPVLLPMVAERNISFGLELADWLGGPAVEKFVLRQAAWTRGSDVRFDFQNRDMSRGGLDINKWVLAAAQLRGAAGRQFRDAHRDELCSIADQISQHLFSADDVRSKLDFLFVENDCGQESLAAQFYPRFSDVVRRSQPSRELNLQVGYLLAMEPATTVDMYVEAWRDYWVARNETSEVVEELKQLVQLPVEKRVAVLDGLIKYFSTAVDRDGKRPEMLSGYVMRELRDQRYGGIDDASSVAYQLEQLRAGPPEGATREWQREQFRSWLVKHAAARPLMVEALATAPEAEFRLFALDAIRRDPTPQYRKLLPPLVADKDEVVRTAAGAVQTYLDELRGSAP